MFSRRRAASNPASKQPPSASASLAASKAFLKDRDSNPTLSSAAAAAALRTHVTPPTRVGDTVTKRMVRKGSTSSHGSGSLPGGGLRRQNSSGSMTERTFRSPSPSRSSPAQHDAPPVPSVPKEISKANGLHRRASSLDPTTRDTSPGPRGGGRGVSLDRGANATPGRGQRVLSLSQVPETSQDGRMQSINFSRPMSPPITSPRAPPVGHGHSGWFGGPVVNPDVTFRGTPKPQPKPTQAAHAQDLRNVRQNVQNAADRPVKKTHISHGVEGNRLATGSMRAKPSGSEVHPRQFQPSQSVQSDFPRPVDPKSADAVYDPSTRSFIRKQDAMARHRAFQEELNEPHEHYLEHHTVPEPVQQRAPQRQSAPVRYEHSPPPPQEPVKRAEPPAQHQQREQQHPSYAKNVTETYPLREQHSIQPPQPQTDSVLGREVSEDADEDIHSPVATDESHEPSSTLPDETHEHEGSPTSPKLPQNQDGPYPRLAAPTTDVATSKPAGQGRGNVKAAHERTQSLSPPRYAHFAPVAVEFPNGVRHQPPPRSVSPAKSALKASPSVSRRNSSPIANNGRVVTVGAPSEPSDTMSDDGQKKKKKNVRVSFDADSVVVGTSAYADVESPASPTGLGASKWSTASDDQDADDFMKPRPVLPSFGSIRDKTRRRSQDDTPEKVTETVPSSMSTSIGSIGEEASSDHALGEIVAQDFAKKNAAQPAFNDPLPPEVTSVEGSGYVSDSSESTFNESEVHVIKEKEEQEERGERDIVELARSTPEPEPKTLTTHVENRTPTPASAPPMEVPMISIQMPSPSPHEKPEPKFPSQHIPGGWDEDESESETKVENAAPPRSTATSQQSASDQKTAEPKAVLQTLLDQDSTDDESDNSSIYSDAYEDLADAEDGGFGSIDAVVESPVVEVSSGLMFSKYADRSQAEQPKSGLQNEVYNEDMTEEATSSSAANRAAQPRLDELEEEEAEEVQPKPIVTKAIPSAPVIPSKSERRAPVEPKAPAEPLSKPTASRKASQPAQPSTQPRKSALKAPRPQPQPTAPTGPQLRKSMRDTAAVAPEPQMMKKSMRTGTASSMTASEPRMRKSMRTTEATSAPTGPSGMGLAASRHSMPPVESKPPRGALQKKHIPAAVASNQRPKSAQAPVATKPVVPTYDSDSDASVSSFQRSRPRPRRNDGGGKYTMRASMRSGPTPTMRTAPTMRSISPPEPASPPSASLRKSMRPTSPPEEPTGGLKYSKFRIRSLSPTGRFKSSKATTEEPLPMPKVPAPKKAPAKIPTFGKQPKQKVAATDNSKSRFKSRFADSSDEEDDRPRRFQSRFADSDDDDDDMPTDLAPVRGIPRKPGAEDGDSTDLDDEASDGEPSPLPAGKDVEKSGGSTLNGTTNGQTGLFNKNKAAAGLPTMEAGKKAKSKRGFFGIGKKKTPINDTAASELIAASTDIPMPPAHRNRELKQQLTPIDEDKDFEAPISPVPARSPKLQRRSQSHRDQPDSEQWPLQAPPKIGQDQRPQSSDGVPTRRSFRPTLSKRHSSHASQASDMTAETEPIGNVIGREVSFGRSGKKKKFQGLRRVFGLNN